MVQNKVFYRGETPYKAYCKVFLLLAMIILTSFSLVSSAEFDNIKRFDKDVGDYGKVTIRNSVLGIPFLQLDRVIELELKENSDFCEGFICYAEKEIVLYETGVLIDDVRFLYTEKDGIQSYRTNSYSFKILNGKRETPYIIGEEVQAGTYKIRLDGRVPDIWTTVDWQIKSNGYWIDEWAVWTSGLNVDLLAYWNMTNTTATNIPDLTGNGFDATILGTATQNISEIDGLLNKAQFGDQWNSTTSINVTQFGLEDLDRSISVMAWVNLTSNDPNAAIIALGGTGGFEIAYSLPANFSTIKQGVGIDVVDDRLINDSLWHHLVAVVESDGNTILYVDGINNVNGSASSYDGTQHTRIGYGGGASLTWKSAIDEIGVWNRTLSNAEVLQLYNLGVGIEFHEGLIVTLNSPNNNSDVLIGESKFNASVTVSSGENITNATLYIWNSTNLVNFTTNLTIETIDTNDTSFDLTVNLPAFDNYTWNYFICSNESTSNPCNWADNNRTFKTENIAVNSQTFNNDTTEGATENFTINFSKVSSVQISVVNLVYNGTLNSFPYSVVGDDIFSEGSIIIPAVDTIVNVSFFYNIILTDSTSFNTSSNNQSVQPVKADNCDSFTNLIYNFTQFDEGDQSQLGVTTNMEIELNMYDLSKTLLLVNFSQEFVNTNPAQICLEDSLLTTVNYSSYVTVKYFANTSSKNYSVEYHNILNQTITNTTVPKNIALFDLDDADTTKFRLIFRDSGFNLAPNILVNVFRKYIVDNDFKVVEIPLTDSNGQTILNLVRNDIVYNLVMINEAGQIVEVFNQLTAFCQDFTIGDCVINLAANSTTAQVYDYNAEFALSITQPIYNNNTDLVTISFVTDDLTPKLVRMDVFRNNQFGNRSVCTNSIISASATLGCDVSSVVATDQFLFIYVYVDNTLSNQYTINLSGESIKFAKLDGAFYAFLLVLLIITLFLEDKKVLVIALGLGWVVALSLGLLSGLIIGATSAGIWLLITIAIYIWKLSKEDEL